MLIFLYGPDSYRLYQAVGTITDKYKTKHQSGVNFFYLDALENGALAKFEDVVKTNSFFNETRLIVFKNILSQNLLSGKILDLVKRYELDLSKETVILAVDNKNQKDVTSSAKSLFRFLLDKSSPVKNFDFLSGAKLENWAKKEFEAQKCSIGPQAVKKLINLVGNNSWALANEIEKLSNYKRGGIVEEPDIDILVSERTELNIFDFIDALAGKNQAKAAELLYKEITGGRDPYYILTMIIYQFRNLLLVKDLALRNLSFLDIAKKAGIHPFVVRKAIQSSNKFSVDELKKLYARLLDFDIATKMGKIDLIDSLYNFVLA